MSFIRPDKMWVVVTSWDAALEKTLSLTKKGSLEAFKGVFPEWSWDKAVKDSGYRVMKVKVTYTPI